MTAATARLEARVTPEQKEFIQHAARLMGRSLSDFILTSLQESAKKAIEEHQEVTVLNLSLRDRIAMVEAYLNPPPPSEKMIAAFRRYKNEVING